MLSTHRVEGAAVDGQTLVEMVENRMVLRESLERRRGSRMARQRRRRGRARPELPFDDLRQMPLKKLLLFREGSCSLPPSLPAPAAA